MRGAQKKLASDLHLSTASVANWFSGKNFPAPENIRRIAQRYRLDETKVRRVFCCETDKFVNGGAHNKVQLPLLAGLPDTLPSYTERDVELFLEIPRWMFPGADFAVRCEQENLAPRLCPGDGCAIRITNQPIAGRLMLVKTKQHIALQVVGAVAPQGQVVGLVVGHWSRDDKKSWKV